MARRFHSLVFNDALAAQSSVQNSDRDKYIGKMVGRFRSFIYADNIQRCIVSVPGNAAIPVTGYLRRREPRWRIPRPPRPTCFTLVRTKCGSHGRTRKFARKYKVHFFRTGNRIFVGIRKEQANCTAREGGEELCLCINSGARCGSGF